MIHNTYKTSDLGKVAYLICRGCRFTTELAADSRKVIFIFSERERAMGFLIALPEDPPVGANSFLSCFQSAKLALSEARRGIKETANV